MLLLLHNLGLVNFKGFPDAVGLIRIFFKHLALSALDRKDVIVVDTIIFLVSGLLLELLFDDLDRALVCVLMPMIMGEVCACRWVMLVQATLVDFLGLDRGLGPPK